MFVRRVQEALDQGLIDYQTQLQEILASSKAYLLVRVIGLIVRFAHGSGFFEVFEQDLSQQFVVRFIGDENEVLQMNRDYLK